MRSRLLEDMIIASRRYINYSYISLGNTSINNTNNYNEKNIIFSTQDLADFHREVLFDFYKKNFDNLLTWDSFNPSIISVLNDFSEKELIYEYGNKESYLKIVRNRGLLSFRESNYDLLGKDSNRAEFPVGIDGKYLLLQ